MAEPSLIVAARSGDVDACRKALLTHPDINVRTNQGLSALHAAIGHPACVRVLLENGADIESVDNNGYSPLYRACYHNSIQSAVILLQFGANVNITAKNLISKIEWTPLHEAVHNDNVDLVRLLLQNGALPNTPNDEPPLILAVCVTPCECIKGLLEYGVDINIVDPDGDTALHVACRFRNSSAVKILLKHNANIHIINNNGNTPRDIAEQVVANHIIKLIDAHMVGLCTKSAQKHVK